MSEYTEEQIEKIIEAAKLVPSEIKGTVEDARGNTTDFTIKLKSHKALDEALKPIEPILYCGHTEEEWQQIIDGGFDVTSSERNGKFKLDEFRINHEMSESLRLPFLINEHWRADAELVREIGHRQPHFLRMGKPNLIDSAFMPYKRKDDGKWIWGTNEYTEWDNVTEYIVLNAGGE